VRLADNGPGGPARERDGRSVFEGGIRRRLYESERTRIDLGYAALLSRHSNERDFDIWSQRGLLLASMAPMDNVTAEVLYLVDFTNTDWADYRRTHLVEPAVRIRLAENAVSRLFFTYEDRDFYFAAARVLDQDGQVKNYGVEQSFGLPDLLGTGSGGGMLTLGYRRRGESTAGSNFDSRANVVMARLRAEVRGELERRRFDTPSVFEPFEGKRDDDIKRIDIELTKRLNDQVQLEARWRWVDWESNVDRFDYDRQVFSLFATYLFR
jgi:hypothetical protein